MNIFRNIVTRIQKSKHKKELETYNKRQNKYNDMLRDETQKQKFLNNMNKIKINTFTKKMVTIILTVCIIDLQIPYILAFFGKEQVVEEATFTWFNRIIAIRYMEINDFLPLTSDNQSLGFRVLSSKDNAPDPEILKFANLNNNALDLKINKEYYFEQVKGYMNYLRSVSDKKIEGYLYSILGNNYLKV